jgi:molybdate transport system substrate-binding protein
MADEQTAARRWLRQIALALLAALCLAAPARAQWPGQRPGPLVFAAASLQESLTAAADAWARQGHPRPVLSFAASSALARQIEAGAPADLFLSADEAWMDALAAKGLLRGATRVSLLGNRLVLIAPRSSPMRSSATRLVIAPGFPLGQALGRDGRLAVADPAAVPAGKYAKAALTSLGVWPSVAARLAPAENVRAALAFVERGEAPLGIVYETDARASGKVRVVGRFPPGSHPPIAYPLATLRASRHPDAEAFRRFLASPAGRAIFRRYGFLVR